MELQKYTYNKVQYYVDYRLGQLRSIPKNYGVIEFISFGDDKGDKIISKMVRDNVFDHSKFTF